MQAEILIIGDEILSGETLDTNSKFIAQSLNNQGIEVYRITKIADKPEEIKAALHESLSRSTIVISTGGLGPTSDDTTRSSIADFFNCELVFNEEAFENIVEKFNRRKRQVNELTRKQAFIPSIAEAIQNPVGTAPGLFIKQNGKIYIALPGVPTETQVLIPEKVMPLLTGHLEEKATIRHFNMLTSGIIESDLSELLKEVEEMVPEGCKLSYLPSMGTIKLRLSVNCKAEEKAYAIINNLKQAIAKKAGAYIFGYGDDTLPSTLGKLLIERNLKLATAESCTGGYICHQITSVPGSSAYYLGSAITYSNRSKEELLNVQHETIAKHGAVSEEVVMEMCRGTQELLKANCVIATSGIAGPTGATRNKPVGMTCIAVSVNEHIRVKTYYLGNNRTQNIQLTSNLAIDMLRKMILETTA